MGQQIELMIASVDIVVVEIIVIIMIIIGFHCEVIYCN